MSLTIKEIRLQNARYLKRVRAGDNNERFCQIIGASNRQQVNNWIGKNPTRAISDATARQMEAKFGLSIGWMDAPHEDQQPNKNGAVVIEQIGLLGRPKASVDDAVIKHIQATMSWVKQNVGRVPVDSLSTYTVAGDAMRDTMPEGTVLLVDGSKTDLEDDGVYLLAKDEASEIGRVWLRKFQRTLDGKLVLSAEHPDIKPATIKSAKAAKLVVLGRAAAVLSVRRV